MTDEPTKPIGNANIATLGANTRFGSAGGADPSAAASKRNTEINPSSVRQKLRRLAVHVPGNARPTATDLARAFDKRGMTELSMAEIWALQRAQQAMGNYKAMDTLIDHIEGKLVNKQVEVNVDSYADLVMAADKLDREGQADDAQPGE